MRGVLGLVTHNWPLKIAAVVVATLLYAGLIVSASAETFSGRIPVQALNQPEDTFVLGDLADVTSVRYLAIGADAPRVSSATFVATIDLTNVEPLPNSPPVSVPVVVQSVDPAIQVIDFSPSRIAVRVDPLLTRDVPVRVDLGTVPSGLDVRQPVVSQETVTISGPDSSARFVTAALARVRIDPSGIDVSETVGLQPIDAAGEVVDGVDVQPATVRVTVQIGSQLGTKTVPINPIVTGSPAAGSEVGSVEVQPALVTIEGEADVLATVSSVATRPISVAEADSDVTTEVGLDLPDGIAALDVEQVKVTIAIRPKSGTRSFEAGIEIVNGDPGIEYRPAVDRVLLTLGGTYADLDALDAAAITARLDVAGLAPGTQAVVVTVRLPAGVSLVSASPAEVTVTLTAIATPTPAPTPTPVPEAPSPTPSPTPVP